MLTIEKKSLIRFVSLYFVSTAALLVSLSVIYYNYQENVIIENKKISMQIYSEKVNDVVYDLKTTNEIEAFYPEDKRYKIAIYSDKRRPIFVKFYTLPDFSSNFYFKNEKIYYIDKMDMKFFHGKYLVLEGEDDINPELEEIRANLYLLLLFSLGLIVIFGYLLSKMFLKPLRNYIAKLDDFIKDTTHELNTPVSAIMMSIETFDKSGLSEKSLKKLNRIDVAAKTIFGLYQDLSFLTLYDKSVNKDEVVSLKKLILERIEYFGSMADVKSVHFEVEAEEAELNIDKNKITILIDNIFSNAIKYNRKNGVIKVSLMPKYLSIEDNGIGIDQEKISDIFSRYVRFDAASGGFGIGLNIVKMICEEYHVDIKVLSEKGLGTKFEFRWL